MNQQQGQSGPAGSAGGEDGDIRQQVREVASDVTSEARATGRTVRDEAAGLVDAAKEQLTRQAAAGKEEVAERISSLADHMRASSDDLRQNEAWLAELVDEGARQLGGLADSLKRSDLRGLIGSVESFARRQPALFAGASVALGFAAARFAKASAERAQQTRADQSYRGPAQTGFPGGTYPTAPRAGGDLPRQPAAYGSETRPHVLNEDQPGAGGHDRAVTSDRWRSADLPLGDPDAPQSHPAGTQGTGVTP